MVTPQAAERAQNRSNWPQVGTLEVRYNKGERSVKGGSNNVAELWAVAEALLFAKSRGVTDLAVYTDSRNNLAWLAGKVGKTLNDREAVTNLLQAIADLRRKIVLSVTWIPRQSNLAGRKATKPVRAPMKQGEEPVGTTMSTFHDDTFPLHQFRRGTAIRASTGQVP